MALWLRRLLILVIAVAILLGLAAGALRFLVIPQAFPQEGGVIELPGLDNPVNVYRDQFGVPHIYASTSHDLLMAQGFIHAQDRFWQMEFSRRIGTARLSEVLGPSALEQDRFLRTLGWHRTAAQEVELLDDETRHALESYSEGVNAYLTIEKNRGLEFTILGLTGVTIDPEPWAPLHTLAYAKALAWDQSGAWGTDLTRAQITNSLGISAVDELMPRYRETDPKIVSLPLSQATLDAIPDVAYEPFLGDFGMGMGSNSWAIGGSLTSSGMPLLSNDPHMQIQMPALWYENGLHCETKGPDCQFDVVGASLPGAPGVILGHNDQIAWGLTNLGADVQDLFIERLNPANPNQYEFKGQWIDMEIVQEEIVVAGEDEPVIVNVRITHHGPIINDVVGGTEEAWSFGWQPLAFSWTALEPGTLIKSALLLNKAQNWDEFREAVELWDVPILNFVYADVEGNIGYHAPGRIPIRGSGDGSVPVPGWDGRHEWVGVIPFGDLPNAFNPPEGYIVTANNIVVDPDYRYFISLDWAPGYRARRIIELIEANDSISLADMQAIQRDNTPLYAQDILHHFSALNPSDSVEAQAIEILRTWDGVEDRESPGAAIFEVMTLHLIDQVFADDLGEQLIGRMRSNLRVALTDLLSDPNAKWFDDIRTPEIEGRDQALLAALKSTVEELDESLGRDPSQWRWGDLHTATFENLSLGQSGIGLIESLFNRGPVEVDGSWATINATSYSISNPYGVVGLPAFRQIVDLGDLGRSLSIHTTGQSGHPYHRHYDDMINPWRNFEYHQMLWDRGQVEANAEAHLVLSPG